MPVLALEGLGDRAASDVLEIPGLGMRRIVLRTLKRAGQRH